MKCKKCGNEIKVREAKFCPFCGGEIAQDDEIAGYTRLYFFSKMGDKQFESEWEEVRTMSAANALAWLRSCPPALYVYRIYGEWMVPTGNCRRQAHLSRFIYRSDVKYVSEHGNVSIRRTKFSKNLFDDIGIHVFLTREECEAAIKEELEKEENQND